MSISRPRQPVSNARPGGRLFRIDSGIVHAAADGQTGQALK
jgi:hypothetical protein